MTRTFDLKMLATALFLGAGLALTLPAMAHNHGGAKPGCDIKAADKKAKWEAQRTARMNALKEKLQITAQQEPVWQAFVEASSQWGAHGSMNRVSAREMNAVERMERMLENTDRMRARLADQLAATRLLYRQLTPEQQAVFDAETLPRMMRTPAAPARHQS